MTSFVVISLREMSACVLLARLTVKSLPGREVGPGVRADHHAERDDCDGARPKTRRYNPHMTIPATRLLVSVRNVAEAEAAIEGGCDVLDIKEPDRGAMGMADPTMIRAIAACVRELNSAIAVSAALGEITDWEPARAVPKLLPEIAYLKLGTAGLGNVRDWATRLAKVMERFDMKLQADAKTPGETASDHSGRNTRWIAVGYADWELARGPRPEEIITKAANCGCSGVLLDTFSKAEHRLVDWLSILRLESLAALARAHGLLLALAGRLQIADLPLLRTVRPDIIGIRSAACRSGIRTSDVDSDAVRAFRVALL